MDPPQLSFPDDSAVGSSPRSRPAETYHDHDHDHLLPPKLRLMCSYGGHIIPRPHDKALSYVGGETRIVVVDRNSSLSSFCSRLSRTLLNGRPFTLKYQLPNEDLDSLVSITTDEDLHNMIEEYDRITPTPTLSAAASSNSTRIRLFIFFSKIETAATMGSLLDDAKSETWFVDALNGSGLIPRGHSDSAAVDNCIVNLDLEAQADLQGDDENKHLVIKNNAAPDQLQYSMPDDSPMLLENSSSFDSSSSSPSMSNLPPIRVRPEDQQKVGMIEEPLAQMSFAANVQKQEDGFGLPPPPMPNLTGGAVVRENMNRILSDDERSDQGTVPVGFRKPPLPLHPLQNKSAAPTAANYSFPSPDSVASDSSIASANSFSKPIYYQEQVYAASRENKGPASPNTKNDNNNSIPSNSQIQIQKVQDSGFGLPPQLDRQQYVHTSMHYIPHPAASPGPVPMSSYYHIYAPQQQQQQLHHPTDHQQYHQLYVMPQQPYMSMQSDTTVVAANTSTLPIYPTKTAKPADVMGSSVYQTAMPSTTPQLVQIPSNQFQPQYVGFPQMPQHHPSQSIASANYGYEYPNPTHDHQVYYTQHQAVPLPSQYQTMTPAAAVAALADASKQLPVDGAN